MARTILGKHIDLNNEMEIIGALQRDRALVILSATVIDVPINSVNVREALRKQQFNFGYTTYEFVKKEWVLSPMVGKVLFLLNDHYMLGTSKILIPPPGHQDPKFRTYPVFAATVFGGTEEFEFRLSVRTPTGDIPFSVHGGDILVCTSGVERTIPYVLGGEAHFVLETYYHSPKALVPLPEDLATSYLGVGGDELRKEGKDLVWSRDSFNFSAI